jgi:hypothetical protein
MKYIIKCVNGTHSKGPFSIADGQSKEVTKEIYDYFNNTFGASGNFNFETQEVKQTKAPRKKAVDAPKETKEVKDKIDSKKKVETKKTTTITAKD